MIFRKNILDFKAEIIPADTFNDFILKPEELHDPFEKISKENIFARKKKYGPLIILGPVK